MTLSRSFVAIAAGTLLLGGSPAYAQHRGGERSRGFSGVAVRRSAPHVVGPRVVGVAPVRYYRPYYTFRPRVSLGFGLFAGYPIAYPSYYGSYAPYYSPYGYASPYPRYPYPAYGYPAYPYPAYPYPAYQYPPAGYPGSPTSTYPPYSSAPGSVGVQPGQSQANTGGVSFEITPGTAGVFLDGTYVGTVDEFTPTTQPLGVTPGRHRIEIRAQGYRTMNFDVDIVAGQVIPYRGVMER